MAFRRVTPVFRTISVVRDIKEREIRVWTDPGRVMRPLFVCHPREDRHGNVRSELTMKRSDLLEVLDTVCYFPHCVLSFLCGPVICGVLLFADDFLLVRLRCVGVCFRAPLRPGGRP